MGLDLWPLMGEGWVCAPACPALLAFLSIFPQLSVNEMESFSALSMKHISAEFQGRVYHKIFLYSEMACCVTVSSKLVLSYEWNSFSPHPRFCLHFIGTFSWHFWWHGIIWSVCATISYKYLPVSDSTGVRKERAHVPFLPTTCGYISPVPR